MQPGKVEPRRCVGNICLRLDIFEPYIIVKTRIEHMECVNESSGVALGRVTFLEALQCRIIVDPVKDLPASAQVRESKIHTRCSQNFALADVLLLAHKRVNNGTGHLQSRVIPAVSVWVVNDEPQAPDTVLV